MTGPERVCVTLVTDRQRLATGDVVGLAVDAARAGVDQLQVREKDLSGRALADLVGRIVAATSRWALQVFVNGRPDVAEAAGAHGVQLPEQGLPVRDVRRAFPRLMIGASRHDLPGASAAEADGADFVVLGPVFATPGKESRALGLAGLAAAAGQLRIPVHAIGGIDRDTAALAVKAGARGVAAIRAFARGPLDVVVAALRGE